MQTFTDEELAAEEWRVIAGYHDYEVSDLGRVRRLGRVLKPNKSVGGYLATHLRCGQSRQKRYIHRLVLETFSCGQPAGHECSHVNGVASDNRLSNLCWKTHVDNERDKRAHGTRPAKLNDHAVVLIRWLRAEHGVGLAVLADWFGVRLATVHQAITGRKWAHVSYGLPAVAAE